MLNKKQLRTTATIAVIIAAVALTIMTSATLSANSSPNTNQNTPSNGDITSVNVSVYNDQSCTQKCSALNWSTIIAGNSVTKVVYIKNTGGQPLTLSMNATNWTPASAEGPLTIGWNQENTLLEANQSVSATISLNVSPIVDPGITNFSFNIIITGKQI
jgi:hypothetical protein